MKNKIIKTILSLMCFGVFAGGVYAALEETINISGMSFSVGTEFGTGGGGGSGTTPSNTALKLLKTVSGGSTDSNLADTVNGATYTGINDVWTSDYVIKVYNKGSSALSLVAKAVYVNDPDTLRDDLKVTIIEWNDLDQDGQVDTGEEGQVYGSDTILRLRNDTFILGQINGGQTRGFIYRFDGTELSAANAGQSASFDFPIIGTM